MSKYINGQTLFGVILVLVALWMLVWMPATNPIIIYLSGGCVALLGLIFLLIGVKK